MLTRVQPILNASYIYDVLIHTSSIWVTSVTRASSAEHLARGDSIVCGSGDHSWSDNSSLGQHLTNVDICCSTWAVRVRSAINWTLIKITSLNKLYLKLFSKKTFMYLNGLGFRHLCKATKKDRTLTVRSSRSFWGGRGINPSLTSSFVTATALVSCFRQTLRRKWNEWIALHSKPNTSMYASYITTF